MGLEAALGSAVALCLDLEAASNQKAVWGLEALGLEEVLLHCLARACVAAWELQGERLRWASSTGFSWSLRDNSTSSHWRCP